MSRPAFAACVALIDAWLARRAAITSCIDARLLNVKGKPALLSRDRRTLDAALGDCFAEGLPREMFALADALTTARAADGFEPLFLASAAGPLDPAMLIARAYQHWDRHRWPGANVRVRHAGAIYGAFVLRQLEALTLRVWDDGDAGAHANMAAVQRLLDALNAGSAADALIRDARWLLQVGQGPLTRGLAPYFRVAGQIRRSFSGADALVIHAAGVALAGGHLRSQLRHRAAELQRPTDAPEVTAVTRNSNAMDVALLVWDLVPLLDAYAEARTHDDAAGRLRLADAILQGISADPELLLTRLDLLAPCTGVETVFVQIEDGRPRLSPTGLAHARTLSRYAALAEALAPALREDAEAVNPAATTYSPLGMEYGFCADLLANMAMDAVRGTRPTGVALEDLFTSGGDPAARQARTDVTLSREWAQDVYARTIRALEQRSAGRGRLNASDTPNASLIVVADTAQADAQEYCVTSDVNLALSTGATAFPRSQIARDREEGRFLASAEVDGRWFAVSKVVVSERLAQGKNAEIALPDNVSRILRLTCPALIGAGG